jgi:hypothetical protein
VVTSLLNLKASKAPKEYAMPSVEYILAGYERGGTTLLSDLFRANGFESGFECGILLAEQPSRMPKMQPYWDMLLPGWNISPQVRKAACKGTVAEFYDTICRAAFPDFTGAFFDKTPRYMKSLGLCMSRAPFLKGAVIIHRDPRAVFVSTAKRMEPGMEIAEAIDKHFTHLRQHFLSYFYGSIGHLENPRVLFIPFEELVSREQIWLRTLGYFVSGAPFRQRSQKPRFNNVTSEKMDLGKVIEFDRLLPPALQKRILDETRIASLFFAGPVERAEYGALWESTYDQAKKRLTEHNLPAHGLDVDGVYFEPLSYLIRYPDVLKSKICPRLHFQKTGQREGRIPA